jgi:hypothetical protein
MSKDVTLMPGRAVVLLHSHKSELLDPRNALCVCVQSVSVRSAVHCICGWRCMLVHAAFMEQFGVRWVTSWMSLPCGTSFALISGVA